MDLLEGEEFRTALSGLLAGSSFARSPALGRLLSYLVERVLAGEGASLKEAVIGHELYGRPASYDPKLDSVVRVSANRLRVRLEDHYRANPGERLRIVLPKGSYVPQLEVHEVPVPQPVQALADRPAKLRGEPVGTAAVIEEFRRSEASPSGAIGATRTRSTPFVLGALSLALVLLCSALWMHLRRPSVAVSAGTGWSVRPFARLGGTQQFGVFSPDGSRLAFTSTTAQDSRDAVYLLTTASEEADRMTAGLRPAWSPDGERLAFLRQEADGRKQVVVRTLSTGAERTVAELGGHGTWMCQISRISWSHDGKTLYTAAPAEGSGTCELVALDLASGQVHPVVKPQSSIGDMEPDVSPDGSSIAFLRGVAPEAPDIFLVSVHGGQARRLTSDGFDVLGFDWSPDGRSLTVASTRDGGTRRLWRVPVDGGRHEALTDGSSAPTFPSVSPQGNQINFTEFHVTSSIWKVEGGKITELVNNRSSNNAPVISPDGREMLYTSDRAGSRQVWRSKVDGSDPRRLLHGSTYETGSARWSPDGREVAMECHIASHTHVCLANADGSGVRQLTSGTFSQVLPSWSHDGRRIYFTSDFSGHDEIYSISATGGATVAVTHGGGTRALESQDGRWLYVAEAQPLGGLLALPLQGTQQEWHLAEKDPLPMKISPESGRGWDVSKDGILYLAHGRSPWSRLDLYNMQTRSSRPVIELGELAAGTDLSIAASPDSSTILVTSTQTHSELSMMSLRR